jgi:enamine deaminase RidA (YjgF/YER057c/UK114 family)
MLHCHEAAKRMCWPMAPVAASLLASIPAYREPAMSKIQRITVPGISTPISHYCHVTRAGPHVWVSGIVGWPSDGNIPSDVVAQFDIAIDVMDKCLKAAGAGPEHVVKVQVFMTDVTERPKINPRRIAYFGENLPASTLVEVKGLVDPRLKVEIECQAYVD